MSRKVIFVAISLVLVGIAYPYLSVVNLGGNVFAFIYHNDVTSSVDGFMITVDGTNIVDCPESPPGIEWTCTYAATYASWSTGSPPAGDPILMGECDTFVIQTSGAGFSYNWYASSSGTFVEFGDGTILSVDGRVAEAEDVMIKAHPNPFNSEVFVDLKNVSGNAEVKILDMSGKLVREFFLSPQAVDLKVIWDGRDECGASVSAGSYVIVVYDENSFSTSTIKLLK